MIITWNVRRVGLELKRAETPEKGSLIGADSEVGIHINPSCLFSSTFVGGGINKCLPNHTGGEKVEKDAFPPYSGRKKRYCFSKSHTVDVMFMIKKNTRLSVPVWIVYPRTRKKNREPRERPTQFPGVCDDLTSKHGFH